MSEDINCSFGLLGCGDFLEDEARMSSKVGTNLEAQPTGAPIAASRGAWQYKTAA
ncbi:hypothetical protein Ancab_003232 [Ancistrocladus abbreviatus]